MFNENLKKRMAKAAIGVTLLAPTVLGTVTSVSNAIIPVVFAETYNVSDGTVKVKPDNTGQTDGTITLNGTEPQSVGTNNLCSIKSLMLKMQNPMKNQLTILGMISIKQ